MKPKSEAPKDVDTYIAAQPEEVRPLLQKLRQTIKKAAPKAEESISYQMPGYKLNGALVYFGSWKNHIGFYPVSSGISKFKKELSAYKVAKGTVQLPLDKPLPVKLISEIVKFRVKENMEKTEAKKAKKKASAAR